MLPIQQIVARLPLPREFADSMRAATMSAHLGSAALSSQGGLQRPRSVEQAEGQNVRVTYSVLPIRRRGPHVWKRKRIGLLPDAPFSLRYIGTC